MTNFFLLIGLFGICQSPLFSQGCLPQGIEFCFQSEIDNFQSSYPGCTVIEGDVTIGGFYCTIDNLDGLSEIISIEGSFIISTPSNLLNLSGLNNLSSIGGDLIISTNDYLNSLAGLNGLSYIGGNFEIKFNPQLSSITALNELNHVGGNFFFRQNYPLSELEGLNELNSIGGDLHIQNSSITSFYGLENLNSIGGSVNIQHNNSITSFSGLNSVISIGGDLTIMYNDSLVSLDGLENINASSMQNLQIRNNESLSMCSALGLCNYLSNPGGVVIIYDNAIGCSNLPEIASTCGISLPCLPYGNYHFNSQASIDNFSINFPNCFDIDGNVNIRGADITNLNGLSQISSVSGSVYIGNNPNVNLELESLSGLENLTSIGEDFTIFGNPLLESLLGVNNLESIGNSLTIKINNNLINLSGLDTLSYIGGTLIIYNNQHLYSLTGMESLTSISGEVQISQNPSLTILLGINNISPSTITNLRIHDNTSLSSCDVESICEYLINPVGQISIYNNSIGCNNQAQVHQDCLTEVKEYYSEKDIGFYPNPANDYITISVAEESLLDFTTIYNHLGQKVIFGKLAKSKIDISSLRPGIYFIELNLQNGKVRRKLIIN